MKLLISTIILIFSLNVLAETEKNVCTVSNVRGMVIARMPDGKVVELAKDLGIPEGSFIKTGEKSFVKLTFIDDSKMTIGVDSLVKITSFPKDKAGLLTLVRGQIRSQVTKNYMEMEDKNKSKLFIRTKTAVMGIRGTDLQVNFESKNEETTLVTYEGKVAMNKLDPKEQVRELNQIELDRVLERKERILVHRGEFSNVSRETLKMESPLRLEAKVIESLKASEVPREKIIEKNMIQKRENKPEERREKRLENKREENREGRQKDMRKERRVEKRGERR